MGGVTGVVSAPPTKAYEGPEKGSGQLASVVAEDKASTHEPPKKKLQDITVLLCVGAFLLIAGFILFSIGGAHSGHVYNELSEDGLYIVLGGLATIVFDKLIFQPLLED